MEKTVIQQLYDMLETPNGVSQIAEMKEWYLTVEREQIEDAWGNGYKAKTCFKCTKKDDKNTSEQYYQQTFRG